MKPKKEFMEVGFLGLTEISFCFRLIGDSEMGFPKVNGMEDCKIV